MLTLLLLQVQRPCHLFNVWSLWRVVLMKMVSIFQRLEVFLLAVSGPWLSVRRRWVFSTLTFLLSCQDHGCLSEEGGCSLHLLFSCHVRTTAVSQKKVGVLYTYFSPVISGPWLSVRRRWVFSTLTFLLSCQDHGFQSEEGGCSLHLLFSCHVRTMAVSQKKVGVLYTYFSPVISGPWLSVRRRWVFSTLTFLLSCQDHGCQSEEGGCSLHLLFSCHVRTMAVSQKKVGVLYTYFSPVMSGPWLSVRRRLVFSTLTFLLSYQDHGCQSEEGGCSLHLLFSSHVRTMAVCQKKVCVLYTYFSPVMSGPWLSVRRRWVFSTLTFLLSCQDHVCQSEEGGCSLHLLFSCHVRTTAVSQKKVGVLYTYFSPVISGPWLSVRRRWVFSTLTFLLSCQDHGCQSEEGGCSLHLLFSCHVRTMAVSQKKVGVLYTYFSPVMSGPWLSVRRRWVFSTLTFLLSCQDHGCQSEEGGCSLHLLFSCHVRTMAVSQKKVGVLYTYFSPVMSGPWLSVRRRWVFSTLTFLLSYQDHGCQSEDGGCSLHLLFSCHVRTTAVSQKKVGVLYTYFSPVMSGPRLSVRRRWVFSTLTFLLSYQDHGCQSEEGGCSLHLLFSCHITTMAVSQKKVGVLYTYFSPVISGPWLSVRRRWVFFTLTFLLSYQDHGCQSEEGGCSLHLLFSCHIRTMAVSQKKVGVLYTYFSPVISGPWLSVRRRWVFSTLTFLLSCQDHGYLSEEGGCSLHLLFSCHVRTMAVSQKKVGVLYTYFSPLMSGPWLSVRRRWVFSTLTFLLSYQDHGCKSDEGGCSLHLLFSCHIRTMAVSQKKVGVLYTYFSPVISGPWLSVRKRWVFSTLTFLLSCQDHGCQSEEGGCSLHLLFSCHVRTMAVSQKKVGVLYTYFSPVISGPWLSVRRRWVFFTLTFLLSYQDHGCQSEEGGCSLHLLFSCHVRTTAVSQKKVGVLYTYFSPVMSGPWLSVRRRWVFSTLTFLLSCQDHGCQSEEGGCSLHLLFSCHIRTTTVSQKKVGVLYTYFSPVMSGPWLSVRRRWVFSTLTFLLSCQDHGCQSEEGGCSLHLLFSCHVRTMAVSQKKVGVLYTYFSPVMSGPWLSVRRRWVFSTLTFLLSCQDHGCQSEEGGCSLHLLFSCHVRTMAVSQKKVGVLYTYFSPVMSGPRLSVRRRWVFSTLSFLLSCYLYPTIIVFHFSAYYTPSTHHLFYRHHH